MVAITSPTGLVIRAFVASSAVCVVEGDEAEPPAETWPGAAASAGGGMIY